MTRDQFIKKSKRPLYGIVKWIGRHNPELLVRIRYFVRFHKCLNLKAPQTLNEKILYLSLRTDTEEWTRLADKHKVRQFVEERGLGNILVRSYGVWDNAQDIDFEKLPQSFVLKSTNGSGDVILVKNKSILNIPKIRKALSKMLHTSYGDLEGGIHYMRMERKIVAEELLYNDSISGKYSKSLIDYKIWCFNGKAYYVWTCCNRNKSGTDVMTYDTGWNPHPEYCIFTSHYRKGTVIPKPENLEELLLTAERLAEGFPVVRVDLYDVGNKIYFGEMTFTSLGGLMDFYSSEFQQICGQKIRLS